jgi:hypothetical protein
MNPVSHCQPGSALSGGPVAQLKFEPDTFQMQVHSVTGTSAFLAFVLNIFRVLFEQLFILFNRFEENIGVS